ncbi:hypothetical protein SAMN05444149_10982 [Pseudosulfitobacter pseudonitzschiae]|nr:hypothetical protein SAMN05444149_10982 [Pseudosulfitobacter pseudonitzschiae]
MCANRPALKRLYFNNDAAPNAMGVATGVRLESVGCADRYV